MSVCFVFKGQLTFAGKKALRSALEEVKQELAEEDEDFRAFVLGSFDQFFRPDGATLHVEINSSGPGDYALAFDAMMESLAEQAASGTIEWTSDEDEPGAEPTRYVAGQEPD